MRSIIPNKNKGFGMIAVLGGTLQKDCKGWRTSKQNEGDEYGITWDNLRVKAGSLLYKELKNTNPDIVVAAVGGKGRLSAIARVPCVSTVLKNELIRMGVPGKQIIEVQKSSSTYEQLLSLKKIIAGKNIEKLILLTNKYQTLRIKAMLKYFPELKNINKHSEILAAEDVLLRTENKNGIV